MISFRQVPSRSWKTIKVTWKPKLTLISFVVFMLPESSVYCTRMVRLCIASVDPVKLSSQCVMCDRREFPLSAIDCTGITKMNDLISSPLSVQEATCLIYNCRRVSPLMTNHRIVLKKSIENSES